MAQPKHVRTLKAKRSARILPILVKLTEAGQSTAADLGISPVEAHGLAKEGLIRPVAKVETGQRGRPALVYKATDKAQKRVKRAQS